MLLATRTPAKTLAVRWFITVQTFSYPDQDGSDTTEQHNLMGSLWSKRPMLPVVLLCATWRYLHKTKSLFNTYFALELIGNLTKVAHGCQDVFCHSNSDISTALNTAVFTSVLPTMVGGRESLGQLNAPVSCLSPNGKLLPEVKRIARTVVSEFCSPELTSNLLAPGSVKNNAFLPD